jgi:hypothetical protein
MWTPEDVRAGCAYVVERARLVHIDDGALETLAARLGDLSVEPAGSTSIEYAVTFNAVNFGSGWHPYMSKLRGKSGNVTLSTLLQQRFEKEGAFSADELAHVTADDCARVFSQHLHPPVDELMGLFAQSWNDLGHFLLDRFDGSFDALVDAADGSAVRLVELLLEMPMYRDAAVYDDVTVPFLKRAQITASDIGGFSDIDRLTVFADNLVPHVLRVEGVLRLDDGLAATIDAGQLLEPGGSGEVELRAAAVEVGERLARVAGGAWTPAQIDNLLWRWGQDPRFKASPRPRARSWFY